MAKKTVELDPNLTLDEAIRDYLASNAEIEKLEHRKAVCKATIDDAITKNGGVRADRVSMDMRCVRFVLALPLTQNSLRRFSMSRSRMSAIR